MGHLLSVRRGWENEKLAAYLLSRVSFVAQPTSVGDDLGTDFFCTLFEVRNFSSHDELFPRTSFAIQIKSSESDISIDNKIEYLMGLEIPFFVGVVSQNPPEMKIYSAELLPVLFANIGKPEKLSLVLVQQVNPNSFYDRPTDASARLHCPFVTSIGVSDDRASLASKVEILLGRCTRARNNIATRINQEHIYDIDGETATIVAGIGSAKFFRNNFLKRLGEVFYNLSYILGDAPPDTALADEINCFLGFYEDLESTYSTMSGAPMPPFLSDLYNALKEKINK